MFKQNGVAKRGARDRAIDIIIAIILKKKKRGKEENRRKKKRRKEERRRHNIISISNIIIKKDGWKRKNGPSKLPGDKSYRR